MSKPSNRQGLIDYCLRQLGAPVLEINIADEQIDDLVDDAIQYFQERHYDGVMQVPLKYKITQDDIDRGKAPSGGTSGITTTTVDKTVGVSTRLLFKRTLIIFHYQTLLLESIKFTDSLALKRCQRECSTSNINC